MKYCPKCQVEKAEELFGVRKSGYRKGQLRGECKACEKVRMDAYWDSNPKKRSEQRKAWRKRSRTAKPDKWRAQGRKEKKKAEERLTVKLGNRLRGRIRDALKNNRKADNTARLLGCPLPDLKIRLQSLFTPGMSWENYGAWHIDHIRPCASFDLSDPAQQRDCFHFSNLQPLWAIDNLRKGPRPLPEPAKTGTI